MEVCGFELDDDKHFIKYYGPYRICAYQTIKRAKGKEYYYYQCRIPIGIRRNSDKFEIIPKDIQAKSLEELDHILKYTFRLDGGVPYYRAPGITIAECANKWFDAKKDGWAENTQKKYRDLIDDHIIEELGDVKVAELDSGMADKFLLSKRGRWKSRSIKQLRSVLKSIVNSAVLDGNAIRNPVATKIPNDTTFRRVIIQTKDIPSFFENVENCKNSGIIKFLFYTGARIAEGIGLTWDELVFEREIIHIDHQYQNGRLKDTKNKMKREIRRLKGPLKEELLALKEEYCSRKSVDPLWNPMNLVYVNQEGDVLSRNAITKEIGSLGDVMGMMGRLTPHSFRATYASHRMAYTGNLNLVQRELGHANPITTLGYIYPLDESSEMFDEKMDYYFR